MSGELSIRSRVFPLCEVMAPRLPGIVLPLTDAARVEAEDSCDQVPEQCKVLLLGDEFQMIWALGVFDRINVRCECLIGDHEDEILAPEKMHELLRVLASEKRCSSFVNDLKELAEEAQAKSMPLLFWF